MFSCELMLAIEYRTLLVHNQYKALIFFKKRCVHLLALINI